MHPQRDLQRNLVFGSVLLVFATACNGGDKDSGGLQGDPPDVAGRYNIILGGTSGCSGESSWIQDWAEGPLAIDGDPSTLTFDFGDEMSFLGSVSAAYSFGFSGDVIWGEAELSVYGSGVFDTETEDDGSVKWVMDGDLEVEVDDDEFETNNCTIDGAFHGYELISL